MKKLFLSAAVALCAVAANAAIEDVRIYINPGHGAFDANSRPMGTVKHGENKAYDDVNNDTSNFFESNTNLQKGLALFHKLKEWGVKHEGANALDLTQNIVMSRIKSGAAPAYIDYTTHTVNPESELYDRNLSEVAAEVEFNNFDMFISIHSNALNDGTNTNYPLLLYRGTDAQEGNAGSINMCKAVWPHVIGLGHQQWTSYKTSTNIRGDQDFYSSNTKSWVTYTAPDGYVHDETDQFSEYIPATETTPAYIRYYGYLGVIKHGVPGFLSEGYFHTYQPARHRYMNWEVCHLEGEAYAWGINDYFGWGKTPDEAIIYGIVRDKDEKFTHEFYKPNASTNDKYLPLNNVKVALLNADGDTVATYTTDDEYNGAFVFRVEPGTYSLAYDYEGYLEPEAEFTAQFTVAAGDKYYPEAFLRNETWTPPKKVYVNYPDSTAGKDGYNLLPKYETKSTTTDLLAEQLAGKAVRRQIIRDNKLYVLALDTVNSNEPYIYLADIAAGSVDTLDMTPVVMGGNGILKISDMALTADHVLVAMGMSGNHYSDGIAADDAVERGYVNIYKWAQDSITALPDSCELWFSTDDSALMNRFIIGQTMLYSGTLENGFIVAFGQHGTHTSDIAVRMVKLGISEGEYLGSASTLDAWMDNEAYFFADKLDTDGNYELTISPLGEGDSKDNQFVLDGNLIAPFEFWWPNEGRSNDATILGRNEAVSSVKANGTNYFRYAGKALMVTPKVNEEGKVCGLQLFNITDGFANAKEIALEGADIEPVEYTYASAHGELALTLSSDDLTTGATIQLYLVVDGKVFKFTVGDFYDSANLAKNAITGTANAFAYALTGEIADGTNLNVTYALNVAATDVTINVLDAEGNVVATSAEGAKEAGEHTATIALADLEDGNYTWEIAVSSTGSDKVERFSTMNFYHPSGLEVDNSMESPSFGTIFVCEGYNQGKTSNSTGTYVSAQTGGAFGGGLYIFTPQVKEVALTESTSTFVMTQVLNKDGGARFYPSWMTNKDNAFGSSTAKTCGADFNEVQVSEDGRIFVSRYNFSGDCYLVAESLEKLVEDGEFTSLLAGKTMTNGIYFDESGNYLAGPAQSFDVKGSGDDLKLLALSRADNSIDAGGGKNYVLEYDLGSASALSTPTAFAALDKKYTAAYDRKTNIQYDNKGGVWYCQYRGTPSNAEPALVYVDANGEIKYFEGTGGKARYQGALAIDPCNDRIAAASASGVVSVYEIITLEDGTVVLNELYRLTHNMGGSAYSASFDTAGNLYLGNASNEVVQGYALPRTEAAVTKAASKYGIVISEGGISGISGIEAQDVPAVYYNLQGIKVENPANGFYIVKRGNKVTKEYIRK